MVEPGGTAPWVGVAGMLMVLTGIAAGQAPAPADSLTAAASDSLPAAAARDSVPDFFDTGIDGTAAVLMTPVFPGWGQLYAENGWRAMLAFGAQWYFWSNLLARDRQAVRHREFAASLPDPVARLPYDQYATEYWEQMRDFAWWSGAILLIVALDAYVGAGLYGFDQEPVPVPDRFDEFFDASVPEPPGAGSAPQVVLWQWGRRF
ncbi:MAG TPA: hypothetical protein PLL30_04835 [Candidatus Krumholzibacteria bacterium]|nr:hypothetical protein [Candidatus Krumholzibacteria bacterium]HPD71091.1 hypothetical protein [Candidatus Krumholzibacteria bacterium]HRY39209.1 hypothetical protein [Candidatus Krumholzibacteria bacterium]